MAMKPTAEQVERATGALVPFVQEWGLLLNPEDLAEIVYAVLVHHDSTAGWNEIDAAVRAQIAEHRSQTQEPSDAMKRLRVDKAPPKCVGCKWTLSFTWSREAEAWIGTCSNHPPEAGKPSSCDYAGLPQNGFGHVWKDSMGDYRCARCGCLGWANVAKLDCPGR